ncbi:cysteine hydrolase family protein [Aspergillus karnatakaensis]|uniref:cysteine hydrolase family protein n=1 Tax=Aspergillus karnatakaensis TaxID=1810916 RepID=UPI003CCD167D
MDSTPPLPTPCVFGPNTAILNLDLMTILINSIKSTSEGKPFIANCTKWTDAIHKLPPAKPHTSRPLTIFTTVAFHPGQPELMPDSPFAKLIAKHGELRIGSPDVRIHETFKVDEERDIVLVKTRLGAGAGNPLEEILRAKGVERVVLSGLSLSGVVLATVYRLFDLDYDIYVIKDNVLELPVEKHKAVSRPLLDVLLPKMGVKVISLEEALRGLRESSN